MKKLFTLVAATLLSVGLWAQDATTYSFANADELNNFTYTAGDASDVLGVYTAKTNNVEPRDGGFLQYKCGKSNKVATFVTTEEFNSISNISFYIASSDKGKTQVKVEISSNADFSADVTEVVNASAGLTDLGVTSPSNNTWYQISLPVSNVSGYVRFTMTATSSGKYWSFDDIAITSITAPITAPVTTVTIAGPTEAYVGEKVTLKATTDVKADTIWWTDQYGAMQVSSKGTFEFTPAAVGSFTYTAWAENANNTYPANQSHTVVVTEAPPVTSCTNLIPASTGDDPVVGDEIALNAVSEGGKIFVAGMKNATGDIKYTAYGLQIGGGGADSLRVELNNYLKEGSIITLKLAAGGTGSRGLNIQTLGKSTVYQAKWEPTAALEENTLSYTIPAGSPLIGASKFLLQRNNTVYLVSIEVANCGEPTGEAVIDDTPALAVAPATVTLAVTASNLNPSANITFSGKNLTPGTYNLTIPNLAGLTITPTSVTVGEDGKLNAQVAISYESAVEVAAASTTIGLTIGELSESATINYSAVLAKNYMSSVNIEQLVVANGTGYNIQGALTAANIEYASINALDSLNDSKGAARNEAYLGMKFKTSGAYIAGWLQASKTLRVKFGNLPAAVKVTLNGAAAADHTTGIFEYTATEDTYVKLATSSSSTVVIKQIMVDEPIANVMYNITYAAAENGSVSGWTVAFPGEDVVMDITSNEGFALTNITYNGTAMVQTAPGAPISFEMPAENVTVEASFGDIATAIDNTEEAVKATKRVINGVLFIEKNGVLYNAQGSVVK